MGAFIASSAFVSSISALLLIGKVLDKKSEERITKILEVFAILLIYITAIVMRYLLITNFSVNGYNWRLLNFRYGEGLSFFIQMGYWYLVSKVSKIIIINQYFSLLLAYIGENIILYLVGVVLSNS